MTPSLFDRLDPPPARRKWLSISERFRNFHDGHPDVYRELARMARELKARGAKRYGMKALFEVLRYHRSLSSSGTVLKLNNNYTAHYARLIEKNEPDLRGFFELRDHAGRISLKEAA